jgi:hypothetical protein
MIRCWTMKLKPIVIKKSHRGLLHKNLGVPEGEKIPAAKLEAARNSRDPAIRKRAVFAENFGHSWGK